MQDLTNWTPRVRPTNDAIEGDYINIAAFDSDKHPRELWEAFDTHKANDLLYHFGWPTMESEADMGQLLKSYNDRGEFVTCVFTDKETGGAVGMASYMRIDCENGCVETGAIAHGATLAKTRAATEAHYLMACRVFDDLGYRRYEWKLNNPNQASHAAARRFGFTFEGVFRQHQVKPYGNRDTAWYSMLDKEWPACKAAFKEWLAPENFDTEGQQRKRLQELREF